MGTTKAEIFTDEQNELANLAKALAHPARIAIVQELSKLNSCVCGELVTEIGLAQSTISQHLSELKKEGLITGETEGVRTCYCLDSKKWQQAFSSLSTFLSGVKSSCC